MATLSHMCFLQLNWREPHLSKCLPPLLPATAKRFSDLFSLYFCDRMSVSGLFNISVVDLNSLSPFVVLAFVSGLQQFFALTWPLGMTTGLAEVWECGCDFRWCFCENCCWFCVAAVNGRDCFFLCSLLLLLFLLYTACGGRIVALVVIGSPIIPLDCLWWHFRWVCCNCSELKSKEFLFVTPISPLVASCYRLALVLELDLDLKKWKDLGNRCVGNTPRMTMSWDAGYFLNESVESSK